MKKGTLILVSAMALVGLTGQAWAAETDTIFVTVELESIVSVAITPVEDWAIGPIGLGGGSASPTYTATNDGNVTVDFTIHVDDSTANNWSLGTLGLDNQFLVELVDPMTILLTSPLPLDTGVLPLDTKSIELLYTAPSVVSGAGAVGGQPHDFSVVVTASVP